MNKKAAWLKVLLQVLSYLLVAVVTCVSTLFLMFRKTTYTPTSMQPGEKLSYLQQLVDTYYIGEVDWQAVSDGIADGMIEALPDRWSYYIPSSAAQSNRENMENAFVGIGITIVQREDGKGYDIEQIESGSGAMDAGIQVGDILVKVEDTSVTELTIQQIRDTIRGEENTQVQLTVERDGQEQSFRVTRKKVLTKVAVGQLLEGNVGYIIIKNFNSRCTQETVAQIADLQEKGATSFVFDVRFNPGGYKEELVDLLDYLLPEGDLFRSQLYNGEEEVDTSDASCLDVPMAVLINADSYSAAEFFAAALREYDKAILVGEQTVGKGYFQSTFDLPDGSSVALSIGKYFTPKGVCLEEAGGLTPDVTVEVDSNTAAKIANGLLDPLEDPQVLAALEALKK